MQRFPELGVPRFETSRSKDYSILGSMLCPPIYVTDLGCTGILEVLLGFGSNETIFGTRKSVFRKTQAGVP